MKNINTKDDFKHSEGKIQLLNGTVLDCYPLEEPVDKVDNKLKLDTTGTYLVVGREKPTEAPQSNEEKEEEKKLFLNNAFRFLQYRDRIMSDSRMFLSPVPIQSGMAYTGTSGFQRPTLGIYLEWWLDCERGLFCDKNGIKKLVCRLAGSPLSGSNRCDVVDENGIMETLALPSFRSMWQTFIEINCRYDEAKDLYQTYTLKQVVEILDKENLSLIDNRDMEILCLKSAIRAQQKDMSNEIKRLKGRIDKLKDELFYENRDALKDIMAVYNEKKEQKEKREKEIDAACKELRKKLKSGEIDNKHYQQQLSPLKKEKENNDNLLGRYREEAVEKLFPKVFFTFDEMVEFINDPRFANPK